MSGLIKSALGLATGGSWILYAVVFGLGLAAGATPAYVWEHRALIAADAQRDQFKSLADTYKGLADAAAITHNADVAGMNTCKAALQDQSDAIAKMQFSLADQNATAAAQAAQSADDMKALNDRIAQQQALIDKSPEADCKPSPEMQRQAEQRVWK